MRKLPRRLSRPEYESALRAEHGNVRRYLAGCRCRRCNTRANLLFWYLLPRQVQP